MLLAALSTRGGSAYAATNSPYVDGGAQLGACQYLQNAQPSLLRDGFHNLQCDANGNLLIASSGTPGTGTQPYVDGGAQLFACQFLLNPQPAQSSDGYRNLQCDANGNLKVTSSGGVQSVTGGTGVTITGTPTNPVINSTGGGGTVTSVTGTGNISTTNATTTPVVQITAAPTFAGSVTSTSSAIGAFNAPNGYYLAGTGGASNAADGYALGATTGTYTYIAACQVGRAGCTIGDVLGSSISFSNNTGTQMTEDATGDVAFGGYLELPNSLTAGNCVQAGANGKLTSAAGACGTGNGTIASISNTDGNLLITNPAGPTATINTNQSPTYTGQVTGGSFYSATGGIQTGRTTTSGAGFIGNYTGGMGLIDYPLAFGYTNSDSGSGNTEFGGNSAVTINGVSGRIMTISRLAGTGSPSTGPQNLMTIDPSGDLGVLANVASATSSTTGLASNQSERITGLSSANAQCLTGASGTNVAQSGQGCVTVYLNGAQQTGTQAPHIEQFNNTPTVANGGTRTYTFATAFATTPVCQVNQSAQGIAPTLGGAQGLWPSSISTTQVVVSNQSGATQTPYLSCIGL